MVAVLIGPTTKINKKKQQQILRLGRPHGRIGRFGREKNLLNLQGFEPLVTMPA
jgi:hypothetical protein